MNKGIKSGIVISDIRNFTGTFAKFEKSQNSNFLNIFMKNFYDAHIQIAESISKNFWYNSLGDSMIFIFMGENHSRIAYTFSIVLHKHFKKLFKEFNNLNDSNVSFGIGVESGNVWKTKIKNRNGSEHITYLGNTINMVSRIETQTKIFGETELLVGGEIYDYLMQGLYPDKYTDTKLFKNYSEILKNKPQLVLMSEKIMLYYIFKMKLTGIDNDIPLFRYDNDLASEPGVFWNVVEKLVGEKKSKKLKKMLD